MNEKEIRAKYVARKCENQMEFDRMMSEMNTEQEHLNHPYLDRRRQIAIQREDINVQIYALHQQDAELKKESLMVEQRVKDINRVFHDLKHELIMMNPREEFVRLTGDVQELS